ncbi:MAG TPA: VRR-NUC domain-containing protein [Propionibacteriaceae bacterium]|nr:VRR-NUC domain-containing protein [Propionibacteriaceae bacterium]
MPPTYIRSHDDLTKLNEKQFQNEVFHILAWYGWMAYHIDEMRYNQAGVPDVLAWRGDQYLLLELKTARGRGRAKQAEWKQHAMTYGVTVHLIRATDEGWETLLDLVK